MRDASKPWSKKSTETGQRFEITRRDVKAFDKFLAGYASAKGKELEDIVAITNAWLADVKARYGISATYNSFEADADDDDLDPCLN